MMREQRFTRQWTDADIKQIAVCLHKGMTGSQIATEFGVSRNSAISIIHRSAELRAIGLSRSPRYSDNQPAPKPRPPRKEKPSLRLVTTERQATVDAWLKANGGPRRFETGVRSDYDGIKAFLERRGYTLVGGWHGKCKLSQGRGRPRSMLWKEVMALVDGIHVSEGLQPFSAVEEKRRA